MQEEADGLQKQTPLPTAIIAGVGPGLGIALCRQLARAGYRVAGLARGTEASQRLIKELGPDLTPNSDFESHNCPPVPTWLRVHPPLSQND